MKNDLSCFRCEVVPKPLEKPLLYIKAVQVVKALTANVYIQRLIYRRTNCFFSAATFWETSHKATTKKPSYLYSNLPEAKGTGRIHVRVISNTVNMFPIYLQIHS